MIKVPRLRPIFAPVFVAVVLIFSHGTPATSFEHLTLARLARTAQIIVRAKCVSNSARWDGGEIWTITTMEPIEFWKGSTSGLITVRLLGGTVGSVTSNVSGVPRFRPGEDLILFLELVPQGDYSVESWGQGTFRVYRDPKSGHSLVTQDTAGLSTFDPKSRTFVTSAIRAVEISKFRAQVAASLLGTTGKNE